MSIPGTSARISGGTLGVPPASGVSGTSPGSGVSSAPPAKVFRAIESAGVPKYLTAGPNFTPAVKPSGDPPAIKEHKKNARPSTQNKHEKGKATRQQNRGGEKADKNRRPNRKPPAGHKGPWPPKEKGAGFAKQIVGDAESVLSHAVKDASHVASDVGKAAGHVASDVGKDADHVASDVGKGISKAWDSVTSWL